MKVIIIFEKKIQVLIIIIIGIIICVCVARAINFANAESLYTWENISNITDSPNSEGFVVDSETDSVYINIGNAIPQFGLENHTRMQGFEPPINGIAKIDWNDKQKWMAIARSGSNEEPGTKWDSNLLVINKSGVLIYSFYPWGQLHLIESSSVLDLKWRNDLAQLAVLFDNGAVRLYDLSNQSVILEQHFPIQAKRIEWNPAGTLLSVWIDQMIGEIRILDVSTNTTWTLMSSAAIRDCHWSANNSVLFVLQSSSRILEILVPSGNSHEIWTTGGIQYIFPAPMNSVIAILGQKSVNFWNFQENKSSVFYQARPLTDWADWTNDGVYFITMDESSIFHVWTKTLVIPGPSIVIDAPEDGITVNGNISIIGQAHSYYQEGLVLVRIGASDWTPVTGFSQWNYSFNSTSYPNGSLTIRAKAIDAKGSSDIALITINISVSKPLVNRPPSIEILSPIRYEQVWGIIPIKGVASDDDKIVAVQLRMGGGSWFDVFINTTGPMISWLYFAEIYFESASYEIAARSFDGIQISNTSVVVVNVHPPDQSISALKIKITYPLQETTIPPNFTVTGFVESGVAEEIIVSLGYQARYLALGVSQWSIEFKDVTPGPHLIRVIAINKNDQSPWESVSFFVSDSIPIKNFPPTVVIETPLNGSIVKDNFVLNGWSSDDRKIAYVEFKLNDASWSRVNGTDRWEIEINIPKLPEDWFSIRVRAYDGEIFSETKSIQLYHIERGKEKPRPALVSMNYLIVLLVIIVIMAIILLLERKKR